MAAQFKLPEVSDPIFSIEIYVHPGEEATILKSQIGFAEELEINNEFNVLIY